MPPVAGGIGAEPKGDMAPRESVPNSPGLPERESLRKLQRRQSQTMAKARAVPDECAGKSAEPCEHQKRVRTPEQVVSSLQARIVKATEAGRWNRVKALQYRLARSHSARVLAVERVTQNKGGKTPGVDGITWQTPERRAREVEKLRPRGYRPLPLRRIYIPKKNGKMRPLGIPAIRDRAMQALYLLGLDPVAEVLADGKSFGFRKERSCADACGHLFQMLARENSAQWVLEGDIKSCFDRISHDWLLDHVPMERGILRKWLKSGYMEKDAFYETEDGTPQGGIISPVLANLALDGLEEELRGRYPKTTARGCRAKVNLVRCADDFIVTGSSKELLEAEVKPLVEKFMSGRRLELSAEKTLVTHIEKGFDFLGWNFRKYRGTLLIKPSRRNVQEFLSKLRETVRTHKQVSAGHLVTLLNPKIEGWANYHCHVVAKRVFGYVDHAIYEVLWRWCKRRHPNKNRHWVAKKYFTSVGGDNWVFTGEVQGKRKKPCRVTLRNAADTVIRRHIPIRQATNPYAPRWREYLSARHAPGGSTIPAKGSTEDILRRKGLSTRQPPKPLRPPSPSVLAAPLAGR